MREKNFTLLINKLVGVFSLMLILILSSACQKEETECILFCQGSPKVSFLTNSQGVNESVGTVRVYVKVDPAPIGSFQINYSLNTALTTASASDYAFTAGTLNFSSGETSKYFEFIVTNDTEGDEGNEYVSFKLGYPTDGDLGDYSTITYAIIDNDVTDITVAEGATQTSVVLSCDDGSGATETFNITSQSDPDSNCTLTSAPVRVSCTPNYKNDHTDWSSNISVDCTQGGVTTPISFTVDVTDTNQAPTATTMGALTGTGAQSGFGVSITYADIMTAIVDETDAEGDTLYLKIDSVDDGTLTLNGSAVSEGVSYMTSASPNNSVVWTPSSSAQGSTAAFKVSVYDGSLSSNSLTVTVDDVFNFKSPTAFAAPEGSKTAGAVALDCNDGSGTTPTFSYISESATPSLNCEVTNGGVPPSYIECTPAYKSGQANWSGTITVRCNIGGTTVDQTATIIATNTNRAPTLTGFTTLTGGATGTAYTISYATMVDKANDDAGLGDADNDTINFRVESILGSGTLTKSGVPVVAGTTVSNGESLVYTPGDSDIGTTGIFTIVAYDGLSVSAAPITVNLEISGVSALPDVTVTENDVWQSPLLVCDDGTGGTPFYDITAQSDPLTNCSIVGSRISCNPVQYKAGQLSWSSDITLECDVDNTGTGQIYRTFTMTVNNLNRKPTLTGMSNITGATFGNPFTISYADLTGAATSFADADGDTLHFRIEGVPEGTLTKNGSAVVPGTTLISTGEEVVWTPETNSVGVTTMFNVVAYDGNDVSVSTIPVKTSLDGIIPIADITTSENVMVETGQILCANSTGSSTTFSLSYVEDSDSNCSIVSDKVRCTPNIKAGQDAWTSVLQVKCTGLTGGPYTRDFTISVDNTNQAPTLTSVSNLQGAVVNTDYTITHTYLASRANESDGDSDPISFKVMSVISGTLKKNGAVVTPGTTMIEDGEQFVWTPGTDNLGPQLAFSIVANDGTVDSTANVDVNVEIAGFLGMADITVAEAATYNSSNLEVNSICNDGANGAKDVTYVSAVDTDANCSEAAGVITCNPNAKSGQSDWSTDVTIRCNTGGTDYDHTFTINVTNANQPPTLTSFSNFVDHDMDTTLTVSYGDLDIKGDANDLDGDPLVYKIVQVPYGTMTKGGSPIVEGTTTIAVGEEVVWTPNSGIIGEVPIMQLKVSDGFNENTNGNIAINAEVRGFTTLADVATTENVQALSAIMTCDDGTSAVGGPYNGAYSILIESDTDSNCLIDGSGRLDCTPAYKDGQSDWSSTITIQCNANSGAEIFSQTVDVNVTNANQAPTLTTINQFAGAVAEVPFTFTHAALLANATDENDPDGLNSQLQFRIETLDNGTLTKGGTAITEGVTLIGPGESVVWTPAATTNGDTTAFTVVAYDGNDASSGSVDVIAYKVVYFESLADQTFTEGSVHTSPAITCTDGVDPGTMTVTAQTDTQSRCLINGDQLECDPFYDDGSGDFSNNWSSDVTIECTGISTTVDQTLTVNVTNVNRAPTLSGVTNFVGAISNEQYVITYANLLANAIVTDADTTDDIGFKIVNVNSGTLTLGGSPVVEGTTILTPGQQLEWTSALSAVGDVVAFTIAANDGTADSATATVTMASIFNFPDISDLTATENSQSLSSALICSNGTGSAEEITIPSPPTNTNCLIDGSNRIYCEPDHRSGQSDWSETVVVRCEDGDNDANFATKSFTLNVNNLNRAPTLTNVTNFVGAQAGIPFNIAQSALITNANEADLDNDTVYFKIMGVTSGTLTKNGSPVIPNTTTFVDGETLVWTPTSTSQGTVAAFTIRALDGFADNGSDIQVSFDAVLRFDAIADISTTENTLQATATLVCDDGSGNSNSNFSLATTDADALCVLSSTTGAPVVNCTPAYKDGHANWSADITVTCESNGYSRDQTFTLSVTDANQSPTLTTITPMKRTAKDTDFSFTYADLLAASDANDGDSDPIKFRIESVEGSSVLKLNGIAVNPGTTLVQTGDTLTWTPPTGAIGTTNAFMIQAYDNTSFSGTDRQVSVHVIEFTDFADQAIDEGASTNFGTLACADGSVDTPTYTLISESDPASNCAIVPPTGLGCSPVHKPGQSSWTSDLVVRCTYGDGKYAEDNVQISVTNINRAPTMTTFDPVATSVKSNGTDFIELTYAQVAALGNEADEDGDTISFRIEPTPNGTLEIDEGDGYEAVTPGETTIDSGDTIKWTPDADTAGDTIAATIVAFDGADPSTPAQNLTINVFKFDAIGGLSVAEEDTGLSSALVCSDGTATTPTYSITSQVDPAVNCSIVGTSLSCNPNFKTSHVDWSSDVTVECDISGKKYQRTTTVTVTEENQEPTMSSITTFTGAYSDTVYSITFEQLMAASDAADPESDPLDFLITSVNSGSLYINDGNGPPVPVVEGTTVLTSSQTLDWTPTGCTGADLIGFKVRARDDQGQIFPESHSPEIDVVINCQQAPAVLSTTDTSNSYGSVAVNNDSADFTINISYAGEMPAEIKNVHLTPGFKITSKTCVDPGNNQTSSCLYNIAYQARPENLGPIKGFFTIHYNDGYQDQYTNYIVSPYLNATGTSTGVGTFTTSGTQAVNSSPRAIASANLDPSLSGTDDLVIANVNSNNISVLQSSSGPAFTKTDLTTGTTPTDVQIADINNDGHLDIVVVNRADADIRIFQGDSTGSFTAQTDVPIGTDPFKLAIADFNGDGNLDVIVSDYTSNNVVYKYGNGDFTFVAGGSVAVGTNPRGIAAGDFNNDGAPEVVVTNYNSANVSLLENDGEGVLSFNTNISVGVNPIEVAVGNTNTDQHLDFVVANYSSGNVMSFTGNGSFGFLASDTELVGASPNAVSLSDVNNDKFVDLIVANRLGSGLVNIRVGANDGTFSGTANQAVGDSPNDVVFADINADGKVDIVTVDEQDSQVTYLIGD